jgi:hypothetical protein
MTIAIAQPRCVPQMTIMSDPVDPTAAGGERTGEPAAREPRDSVMLSATVERFGAGAPTRHRVRDLSTGGVRIDQAIGLHTGATVLVSIGALQAVGATVVWVEKGSAGLRFLEPINPDDARAKAAIAPRPVGGPPSDVLPKAPTAGWVRDLNNPYRKA